MELVDMIDLGSIGSNIVQVQVLPIVICKNYIINMRSRDPGNILVSVSSLMDRAQDFDSCW
jgi:uncharacterized membrane protein